MEQWMDVSYRFLNLVDVPGWVPLGLLIVGGVSFGVLTLFIMTSPRSGQNARRLRRELGAVSASAVIIIAGVVIGTSADTSESVSRHLDEVYQVEVLRVDQTLSKAVVQGGVAVDVPGDDVVKFVSDGTTAGDKFVDAQGREVDIEVYRVLDAEAVAEEVAEVSVVGEPVVSFAQSEMSGKMASENSDAVLVSGVVDGVRVQASVLVDDHGNVRDVRVEGKSLLK